MRSDFWCYIPGCCKPKPILWGWEGCVMRPTFCDIEFLEMAYEKDIMIESNFAVRKCWMRSISSLYKPWSHTRTLWAQNLSQDLPCPGAAGGFSPFLRQVTNESVVWVTAEVPKVPWLRSMLPRGVLPGALSSLGIWKQAGTYCAFGFSRPSGWRKLIKHDKNINGFPIFASTKGCAEQLLNCHHPRDSAHEAWSSSNNRDVDLPLGSRGVGTSGCCCGPNMESFGRFRGNCCDIRDAQMASKLRYTCWGKTCGKLER